MPENLAVAPRWVELYNDRGDVAEFLSLLDPEVELQTPDGPRLRGDDEARDWHEKEFENVRSRIIPDRFVEEGDIVAGLRRTEVRWIESREIAHEFESAGVFWLRLTAEVLRLRVQRISLAPWPSSGSATYRDHQARGDRGACVATARSVLHLG